MLGLVVWEEMPSAYRFTRESVARLSQEWIAAIARDYSHPCIVAWVPINESWGVPNLPESPAERHYVQALYHLTKTLDAKRVSAILKRFAADRPFWTVIEVSGEVLATAETLSAQRGKV